MTEQYLEILIDSLEKKIRLMDEISGHNRKQSELLEKAKAGSMGGAKDGAKGSSSELSLDSSEELILSNAEDGSADTSLDFERFDEHVSAKEQLLRQLTELDDGFELVYDRVKKTLSADKEKYSAYIVRLQALIAEVMERSTSIQAQESRNRQAVEQAFRREREKIGERRKTSQAAINYYRSVSGGSVVQPQFLDWKK
ncbi:MAG: hypothetical protein LBQ15_04895 [Clostridium sp.]|jgi:hypothetical protein|nr:hypothetical protein [Clostridium sp.]